MAIAGFKSIRYHPRVEAQQGFTLIEIVVALAIVAIGVLSVAEAMIQHTQVAGSLEKRVMAAWVASNQIALLTHDSKISRITEGSTSEVVEMGGHKWRAQSKIRKTDVERVFLLTVTVKDESRRQEPAYATMTTAISDAF
ncbi:MAG: general secretion pathway protein I [Arenicella sp.]|jgi:general secretion pathway protein I